MTLDYFIKTIPENGILHLETDDTKNEIELWFNHRNEYMTTLIFENSEGLIEIDNISPAENPEQLLEQIKKFNPNFPKYDWIVYRERSELIAENSKLKEEIKTLKKTIEECDEIFFLIGDV